MRVALISNTAWLDEELSAYRSMVVGLMGERVRVVQVVPDRLAGEQATELSDRLLWHDSSSSILRRWRLPRIGAALGELGVDLVHALDGRLWHGVLDIAARLEVPAVLSASSAYDLPLARRLARRREEQPMAFTATTAPLAQGIKEALPSEPVEASEPEIQVEMIPPGVHLPELVSGARPSTPGALCAVISGTGVYDPDYEAIFAALPGIVSDYPQAQFFLDGQGRDQHLLWRAARRFGILSHVSLVPRRLGHRELLLGADVLIQPQALGKSRGLTLQAMARAMPVLARQDPHLDYLLPEQTAWVVDTEQPEPAAWSAAIRRLIERPAEAQDLGVQARQWVGRRHSVSRQVGQTVELYRRMTGETMKFPDTSRRSPADVDR